MTACDGDTQGKKAGRQPRGASQLHSKGEAKACLFNLEQRPDSARGGARSGAELHVRY